MKDRAYAKINLALDVFNVREDGYHDINSIMLPISFYDELEINVAEKDSYECNVGRLLFDENNSIYKMIKVFKEKYNINDHYEIKLNKIIPSKAGLGGGTSDGASTLRILKRIYNIKPSRDEIKEMCLSVGADVLFSYYNKPAVVSGVGDQIETFNIKNTYNVLLVKPHTGVSTKQAYDLLNMNICDHPNINKLKEALICGDDINGLLGNSLEQPAMQLNKHILEIKNKLKEVNASNVLMSGSGSTVFCISKDEAEIKKLYNMFKNSNYFARFCKTMY